MPDEAFLVSGLDILEEIYWNSILPKKAELPLGFEIFLHYKFTKVYTLENQTEQNLLCICRNPQKEFWKIIRKTNGYIVIACLSLCQQQARLDLC